MRERLIVEGEVIGIERGDLHTIKLGNNFIVRARRAGRLVQNKIRIVLADMVLVELDPTDLTRGRILRRL